MDWKGHPVPGATIIAEQVKALKGYDRLQATTTANGTFHIDGLYPNSNYVLSPVSENWEAVDGSGDHIQYKMGSGPVGETLLLRLKISYAYSAKHHGAQVVDLVSGKTRFTFSQDKVIQILRPVWNGLLDQKPPGTTRSIRLLILLLLVEAGAYQPAKN